MTTLTILVPTIGRPTLVRTLRSIEQQQRPVVPIEVIVVGDTADGPLPFAQECARILNETAPARYLGIDTGRHTWGHLNCQAALAHATGSWLFRVDDDDILTPAALSEITRAIADQAVPRPMLFRFLTPERETVWREPRLEVGQVGTPSMVAPTDRLGKWGARYEGDFDFIKSTVDLWPGAPEWREEVVCITRPTSAEDWTS